MRSLLVNALVIFAPGILGTLAIAAYVMIPAPIVLAILLGLTLLGQGFMLKHSIHWLRNEQVTRKAQ
jgi:hypothetical protein